MRASKKSQSGVSLIEILVAMLVLSIGLLGIAGLQGTSLTKTREANLRTNAMVLAQDIIDKIRANRLAIASYSVAKGGNPTAPGKDCADTTVTCNSTELATYDLDKWWKQIVPDTGRNTQFPGGDAAVDVTTENNGLSSLVTVSIFWNELEFDTTQDKKVMKPVTFRLKTLI